MFAGHDEPLELVNHLSQQVESLSVLFHAVCDHLRRCHHLLAQMPNVQSAMLNTAGHRLNGGPELFHAALFGELRRLRMLAEALCQWVLGSIVTRGSRGVDHQGTIQRLF